MSEFRFACKHCGQRISGEAAYRGREIECPACHQKITVPSPTARDSVPKPTHEVSAPPVPATAKINPLALTSVVCVLGLAVGSIPGILLGHRALKQLRRNPTQPGKGVALAGLALNYALLLIAVALVTVGFAVLRPRHGHQLNSAEMAAHTPAVIAAHLVDEVKPADPLSESAHGLQTRSSSSGTFSGRKLRDAWSGFFSYSLAVDAVQPMSLYCTYWGNEGLPPRRFDVLVNEQVIATQILNFNDPGHFFDVEYRIPEKLTHGQTNVTVVFQAYPGKIAGGLFGCRTERR